MLEKQRGVPRVAAIMGETLLHYTILFHTTFFIVNATLLHCTLLHYTNGSVQSKKVVVTITAILKRGSDSLKSTNSLKKWQ